MSNWCGELYEWGAPVSTSISPRSAAAAAVGAKNERSTEEEVSSVADDGGFITLQVVDLTVLDGKEESSFHMCCDNGITCSTPHRLQQLPSREKVSSLPAAGPLLCGGAHHGSMALGRSASSSFSSSSSSSCCSSSSSEKDEEGDAKGQQKIFSKRRDLMFKDCSGSSMTHGAAVLILHKSADNEVDGEDNAGGYVDLDDLLIGGAAGLEELRREEKAEALPALLEAMGRNVDALLAGVGFIEEREKERAEDVSTLSKYKVVAQQAHHVSQQQQHVHVDPTTTTSLPMHQQAHQHITIMEERKRLISQLSSRERAWYANAFDSEEEEEESEEVGEGETSQTDDVYVKEKDSGKDKPSAVTASSSRSSGGKLHEEMEGKVFLSCTHTGSTRALSPSLGDSSRPAANELRGEQDGEDAQARALREEKNTINTLCAALVGEHSNSEENARYKASRLKSRERRVSGIREESDTYTNTAREVVDTDDDDNSSGRREAFLASRSHPKSFVSLMREMDDLTVRHTKIDMTPEEALDVSRFPSHVSDATKDACHDALRAIMLKYGGGGGGGGSKLSLLQ